MEDQGEIHYCLGMSIKRDREARVLYINQKAYLEGILKRFGMFDCKSVFTPMKAGKRFDARCCRYKDVPGCNWITHFCIHCYKTWFVIINGNFKLVYVKPQKRTSEQCEESISLRLRNSQIQFEVWIHERWKNWSCRIEWCWLSWWHSDKKANVCMCFSAWKFYYFMEINKEIGCYFVNNRSWLYCLMYCCKRSCMVEKFTEKHRI